MPARPRPALLLHVGERIAAHRVARGWTQDTLATELDIATKNVQRIEAGGQNLTLLSLERIARALEVEVTSLIGKEPLSRLEDPTIARLRAAGIPFRDASTPGRRRLTEVPLVDLRPMGGRAHGGARSPRILGWVDVKGDPREGSFVARIEGNSMAPKVPHGSIALFARARGGPLSGRAFLVAEKGDAADGVVGPYVVKRIANVRPLRDGRLELTLRSDNRGYEDRRVVVEEEDDSVLAGELIRTLVK